MGATGRPVIIVSNHNSFLDTILLVGFVSLKKVAKVKMFVSAHLLKIPALGTIVLGMGHLVVPFKASGSADSMELDKDLMALHQQELEDHVRAGGIGAWFPEGRMNPGEGREVLGFRAGGFVLAARVDAEVWCVASVGNNDCWPRTGAAGGYPARIGVRFVKLCDSTRSLLVDCGYGSCDEREQSIFLANSAHSKVQESVSDLFSQLDRDRGPVKLQSPLL